MADHSSWSSIRRRHRERASRGERREAPGAGSELVRYEGYGPGGAALVLECLTDDRVQLGARLRSAFLEHGGNLGAHGSVSYLFNTVGLMSYPPGTDAEQLLRVALEAGAEDVVSREDRSLEVLADPRELETVCALLTQRGFAPAAVEVTERAASAHALSREAAVLMVQLLEELGELEEVREVYSNAAIADEVLNER